MSKKQAAAVGDSLEVLVAKTQGLSREVPWIKFYTTKITKL